MTSATLPSHRARQRAFTLIELVMAVALLGGSFMTLLLLRSEAVQRAGEYNRDRLIQRLAQEKLDEVVYELEENRDGDFSDVEELNFEITWAITGQIVSEDLIEATITLTYPISKAETEEYTLSTWFFADPEHAMAIELGTGLEDEEEP